MNTFQELVDWLGDGSHWSGPEGIPNRLLEHIEISAVSLVVAVLIAVPAALVLGHLRRGGFFAVNISNIGRALPAIAVLLFAVLVFGVGDPPAVLRSIGVGSVPAFLALVALAIPPIFTNTYTGVAEVPDEMRETARGMGMSGGQVLRRVELPLAIPLLMAGVRTSAVAVVATATLAAYVGWGGLGRFIIDGFRVQDDARLLAGALLVALLAIVVEAALAIVQRVVTSRGLRLASDPERRMRRARVAADA